MLSAWGPSGPETVELGLSLDNAVMLVAPELWQLVSGRAGPEYVVVAPLTGAGVSGARWQVKPDDNGECHLLLNWQATDPEKGTQNYDRTVVINYAAGAPLPARSGSTNPSVVTCKIGPTPPNWSSVQESISIW